MHEILHKPVTVVEAPAGYGKTSAVREALINLPAQQVHWFTAVNESSVVSYKRLCRALKKMDAAVGAALESMGYPNRSNEEEITLLIQQLESERDVYLVLDNLQFLQRDLSPQIFRAFTEIFSDRLHIIMMAYDFSTRLPQLKDNHHINYIGASDMVLQKAEIRDYFARHMINLKETEAETIFQATQGWVLAVSFHLIKLQSGAEGTAEPSLFALMDEMFWSRLEASERRLLLPFAIMDSLTTSQLQRVLGAGSLNESNRMVLQRTPLLRLEQSQHRYFPHLILSTFLKTKLDQYPELERRELYRRFGEFYLYELRSFDALACFYEVKDYESILSSPLELLEFAEIGGKAFAEIIVELLEHCPQTTRAKYPIALLKLAYYLFNAMNFRAFDQLMREAHAVIWALEDEHLKGEWYLTAAFYDFPKPPQMCEKYRLAETHLQHASEIYSSKMPFMFGNPSQWFFFYTEPGQGDLRAEELTEMLALYGKMTNGHGQGTDLLYKGELAAMRCRFNEAEIYAYQAAAAAEAYHGVTVSYGVALLLGRIAISKGDMDLLDKAIAFLENKASAFPYLSGTQTNQTLLELVRSMLLSMLERVSETPAWTKMGQSEGRKHALATIQLAYVGLVDLLLRGELTRAVGIMEWFERSNEFYSNCVMRYFVNIGLSMAYLGLREEEKALHKFDQALSLAELDDLLSTFIHYRKHLTPLLSHPLLQAKHKDFIDKIFAQELVFQSSDTTIFAALASEKMPSTLTPREEEIARLIAQGLRNREIAETLIISESTVKNHIQNIYSKLTIDRRSKLVAMLN